MGIAAPKASPMPELGVIYLFADQVLTKLECAEVRQAHQ